MKVVADVYGKEPLTKEALKMFFMLWADYSLDQVKQALQEHMRTSVFMPKPADIIARIEGTAEDRAKFAWQIVVRAIQRLGHYESVRFPSPAYHYAIEQMGGWQGLCVSLRDDGLPFRGKDFERFFEIGERVASWDHAEGKVHVPAYLCGLHEYKNRVNGYTLPLKVKNAVTGEVLPDIQPSLPSSSVEAMAVIRSLAEGMKAS
jgi:hypothetical protein